MTGFAHVLLLGILLANGVMAFGKVAAEPSIPLSHAQATKRLMAKLEPPESVARGVTDLVAGRVSEYSFVVHFDYDRAEIRPEFQPLLAAIGEALSGVAPKAYELEVAGHTDWDGSDRYNFGLSQRRATAVERYLAERFRIVFLKTMARFLGEGQPAYPNTTREGMAFNRRVEFVIRPATAAALAAQPLERFAVAYAPDGGYALSAGDGNELRLWNTRLDCQQRSLAGHLAKVVAADFSPNGRLALSGAEDDTVRLWDVATGREIQTFYGHRGTVQAVTIAADGRSALSGSDDHHVKLWNLVDGREVGTLQGHSNGVTAVDFSPNGFFAVSGDRQGSVVLWDITNKKELRRLDAARSAITSVVFFHPDAFLVASLDGSVKVWDRASGQLRRVLVGDGPAVLAADVSHDGRFAAAVGLGGMVKTWVIATGVEHRRFDGHRADVIFVAFSNDGDLVLTADSGRDHRLWDYRQRSLVSTFEPITPLRPEHQLVAEIRSDALDQLWREPQSGLELGRLPAGCFAMGCGSWTENCSEDELPVHEACVGEFWIGRYEVTQGQWSRVMGTNPSRFKRGGNYPVEQVSWQQAQDFACRLNKLTGLEFQVPTEAQWEYACRSGGRKVKYSVAPSAPPEQGSEAAPANGSEMPPYTVVEAGAFNAAGLANMGAGVWEWVADVYEDDFNVSAYSMHTRNDPLYAGSSDYRFSGATYARTNRGGSWRIGSAPTRCSLRHFDNPHLTSFFTGFRVAVSSSGAEESPQ